MSAEDHPVHIAAGAVHADVIQRRECLRPEEVNSAQIEHELIGYTGVALNVAAQPAAVDGVDLTYDGNGHPRRRLVAHNEGGSAAALQILRRYRRHRHRFTAKLAVAKPDGRVVILNNGILRTAFRDSLSAPTPTVPGRPYTYQIQVWPTSYEFRTGDRIRREISSSHYPAFAPNPNTGAPFGDNSAVQTATQTISHDGQHPSTVTLPVTGLRQSRHGASRWSLKYDSQERYEMATALVAPAAI
jgi:hypothetical protein